MSIRWTNILFRCAGRNPAAALALLLGLALVHAPAEASGCGRHVAHGTSLSAQLHGLRGAIDIPTVPLPPPKAPEPCSGPGCSDAGRPLPSAPSSTVPVSLREWCSLAEPAFVPRSPASAAFTDDPTGRPALVPAKLERPPRPFA